MNILKTLESYSKRLEAKKIQASYDKAQSDYNARGRHVCNGHIVTALISISVAYPFIFAFTFFTSPFSFSIFLTAFVVAFIVYLLSLPTNFIIHDQSITIDYAFKTKTFPLVQYGISYSLLRSRNTTLTLVLTDRSTLTDIRTIFALFPYTKLIGALLFANNLKHNRRSLPFAHIDDLSALEIKGPMGIR